MSNIVTDIELLNKPCRDVTIEEGEKIATELFKTLTKSRTGVGLAANQIGIDANVCVINVKEPIYLINPRYVETHGEMFFDEACLSFPGRTVKTKRFQTVTIEADNFNVPVGFTSLSGNPTDALETAAVQHELDHIFGITMFDRKYNQKPIIVKKIGRNDIVNVKNNTTGNYVKIKYKKIMKDIGENKTYTLLD